MQDNIFIQYTPNFSNSFEQSILDLDFAFETIFPYQAEINLNFLEQQSNQVSFEPLDILSDTFSDRNLIQNSTIDNQQTSQQSPEQSQQPQISNQKKFIAKSKRTKNICFNICQKTIKVMKTRTYDAKLQQIAKQFGLNSQKVIHSMLKVKNDLTGPKALKMFVQTDDSVNKTYRKFMKWFLEEKYLRHAINQGSMDDLKGYLEFKNQVILSILEN